MRPLRKSYPPMYDIRFGMYDLYFWLAKNILRNKKSYILHHKSYIFEISDFSEQAQALNKNRFKIKF